MLIPVRCFSCNKVIGHLWNEYNEKIEQYIKEGCSEYIVRDKVFNEIGFSSNKYCCRRMFLGHVDVIDELLKYSNNPGENIK